MNTPLEATIKRRVRDSKANTKKRGEIESRKDQSGEHSLTYDQVLQKYEEQQGKCATSKLPMSLLHYDKEKKKWVNGNSWTGLSIDRIDCSRGYHLDNIKLVCWSVNSMRRTLSEAESDRQFYEFVELIMEVHSSSSQG